MTRIRLALILTVSALALTALHAAQAPQSTRPDLALQAAIKAETIDGDLKAAIEMYRKLADGADRAVAAQALARMGQCYERLGASQTAEARKAYERLVRDFGDQSPYASQARARLAAMGQASASASREPVARLFWAKQNGSLPNPEPDGGGVPSPDGRFLVYTGGEAFDLYIYEVATGTSRRITSSKGCGALPSQPCEMSLYSTVWSPDGSRIAFAWMVKNSSTLQVINTNGTGQTTLLPDGVVVVADWSPDGRSVLVFRTESTAAGQPARARARSLVAVSVADGSVRTVIPASAQPSFGARFSPDGRFIAYQKKKEGSSPGVDLRVMSADGTIDAPVIDDASGTDLLAWAPDGSALVFFSERGTSLGLWSVPVVNGKRAGEPRLVKGDLGVTDATYAGVTRDGSVYYSVRGSTSDVYLATLDATGGALVAPPSNAGFAGIGANAAPAWSADGKTLAFLSETGVGPIQAGILNTINFETGARRRVTLAEPMSAYGSVYGLTGEGTNLTFRGPLAAGDHAAVDVRSGEVIRRVPKYLPRGLSRDGTLGYTVTADRTTKSTTVTVTDLVSLTSKESCRSAELFSTGTRFNVSPDGQSAAFESPTGSKQQGSIIRILRLATCELVDVYRTEEPSRAYDVVWTPDGKRLLFSTQDWSDTHRHQLWSIPAAGGKPTLYDVNIGLINRIAVNPDGRRLACPPQRAAPAVGSRALPPAGKGARCEDSTAGETVGAPLLLRGGPWRGRLLRRRQEVLQQPAFAGRVLLREERDPFAIRVHRVVAEPRELEGDTHRL